MKNLSLILSAIGLLMIHSVQAESSSLGMKDSVLLPPAIAAFITSKEQQAEAIASNSGFVLPPDFGKYFAFAKAGHAQEARRTFSGLLKDTNSPEYKTPLKQVALDVELALEAFASGDSGLVQSLGGDFMNSLPAGCIYFGGTDAGRGLPASLCKSAGDPVFVLSQNAFLDSRYMAYIRGMYGAKISLPTEDEIKDIVATASAGKTGFSAYVAENNQIMRNIMAKNPGHEFYYEQSFPIDDLSSNLSPHGLVMKINPEPLAAISANDIKTTDELWAAKIPQLTGNPAFTNDTYVRKVYAHERSVIAAVYAHRAQASMEMKGRRQLCEAAEQAFRDALILDPVSPETIPQYAMFKAMVLNEPNEALAILQTASQADPSNLQFKTLIMQLKQLMSPPKR